MSVDSVLIVGGGPAGLFAASLLAEAGRDVLLVERRAREAAAGLGIVLSRPALDAVRRVDVEVVEAIERQSVSWDAVEVRLDGESQVFGGHPYIGISRGAMLEQLVARAAACGAEVRFEHPMSPSLPTVDLVVGADGVSSGVRAGLGPGVTSTVRRGTSRYVWFETGPVVDRHTFSVRRADVGALVAHAYPHSATTCSFIVECTARTWRRLALDEADVADSAGACEHIFRDELGGLRLTPIDGGWRDFRTLTCRPWSHEKTVLIGDAAHTAHFSIGSGTRLALQDAAALAAALEQEADIFAALLRYESERRPAVERAQYAAARSQTFFEHLDLYASGAASMFAARTMLRSGRLHDRSSLPAASAEVLPRPAADAFARGRLRVPSRLARVAEVLVEPADGVAWGLILHPPDTRVPVVSGGATSLLVVEAHSASRIGFSEIVRRAVAAGFDGVHVGVGRATRPLIDAVAAVRRDVPEALIGVGIAAGEHDRSGTSARLAELVDLIWLEHRTEDGWELGEATAAALRLRAAARGVAVAVGPVPGFDEADAIVASGTADFCVLSAPTARDDVRSPRLRLVGAAMSERTGVAEHSNIGSPG